MSNILGLTIEGLVAVLLLLTILYCARLNSRLKLLKADERMMKTTITELMMSTENAERAIAGLNATIREAEQTLSTQLRDAEIFTRAITDNLKAGEDVLSRLRKVAHAGKVLAHAEPEPEAEPESRPAPQPYRDDIPADTSAMVAAAQAFAERTRSRVRGLAA
jgi:uncharacterized protein DUF6468